MGKESKEIIDFDSLYSAHKDKVFRVAMKILRNESDAEDVMQEVFLKYHAVGLHMVVEKPSAMLTVMAYNISISHIRKKKREEVFLEKNRDIYEQEQNDVADEFFESMWRLELIRYADIILRDLKKKNKNWYVIILYTYLINMPANEIAEMMGVTRNAVDCAMQRAKKWIRETYGDEFEHIYRK